VLETNLHQVTDDASIPTGEITAYSDIVAGEEFVFGDTHPDVDHCFIISRDDPATIPADTRAQPLRKLITLTHPGTKIHLEAWSTEPAFQVYAGRYIDVAAMDGMPARGKRSGICIEASRYINAVNVPAWRPMVSLRKGMVYGSRTVYRAWEQADQQQQ
jgi:aldose 1-epimerase